MKTTKFRALCTLVALAIMSLIVFSSCSTNERQNYLDEKYPWAVEFSSIDEDKVVCFTIDEGDEIISFEYHKIRDENFVFWVSKKGRNYSITVKEEFFVPEITLNGALLQSNHSKVKMIAVEFFHKDSILTPFDTELPEEIRSSMWNERSMEIATARNWFPWLVNHVQPETADPSANGKVLVSAEIIRDYSLPDPSFQRDTLILTEGTRIPMKFRISYK